MKIGDLEIQGRVILGPMAGVTSLAYREFMKPFGVALSYSEMVSDCGLDYGNERTFEYLATSQADRPVGIQLFGFDPAKTVEAIAILEKSAVYDILDINLGCPVYKVVKTGAGSAWLRRPDDLYEYMVKVVKASHKPVTAKIRLGWDEASVNVLKVSSLLEKAGVAAITVHCRTTKQGYTGRADYFAIKDLKAKLQIPLFVSGDIWTPQDAKTALGITHADGVMVARGGLGNPYLITRINRFLEDGVLLPEPTVLEQVEYAERFAKMLIAEKGEIIAVKELRGLVPHFFSGFPGYKKIRGEISQNMIHSSDLFALLDGIRQRQSC